MIIVPKNEGTSFNQDTITAVNGQVSAGLCMKYMCVVPINLCAGPLLVGLHGYVYKTIIILMCVYCTLIL